MKEFKVVKEVAEKEFEKCCEAFDIDTDIALMDKEDKSTYESIKQVLVRSTMRGDLTFNEQCQPVFNPSRYKLDKPLTFREPTGADLMQMDESGDGGNKRICVGLACLTDGVASSNTFGKMPQSSLKVCKAIWYLFMG